MRVFIKEIRCLFDRKEVRNMILKAQCSQESLQYLVQLPLFDILAFVLLIFTSKFVKKKKKKLAC